MKKKIILSLIIGVLLLGFLFGIMYFFKGKNKFINQPDKKKYPELIIDKDNVIKNPTKEDLEIILKNIKKQNQSLGNIED